MTNWELGGKQMWWAIIIGGLFMAILVSGFSKGAARLFEPESEDQPDSWDDEEPWDEPESYADPREERYGSEWNRDDWDYDT